MSHHGGSGHSAGADPHAADPAKITVPWIRSRKGRCRLVMTTAYDRFSAEVADRAGVEMILVGDSAAMVVHGHEDTLGIGVDEIALHLAAVRRCRPRALVIGDMPYLSYHTGRRDAVLAAGRLVREGGAEAVKLEGGAKRLPVIEALLDAEIPVIGHLGLTPQSVHAMGGYRVQGRGSRQAEDLLSDARALAEAGVFALVLEGIPAPLAEIVTKEVSMPTIGIGAGKGCDGQVLVFHDLLGMFDGPQPRFVRRYADLQAEAVRAMQDFARDVRSGAFPSREESYASPKAQGGARSLRSSCDEKAASGGETGG